MFSFIWALVIGLIVGAVAKLLVPGKDPGGWIVTMLLGVTGAFIGTMLGQTIGLYDGNETAGFIVSILGAMLVLWGYRVVTRGRASE